jgi:hypothetical protein
LILPFDSPAPATIGGLFCEPLRDARSLLGQRTLAHEEGEMAARSQRLFYVAFMSVDEGRHSKNLSRRRDHIPGSRAWKQGTFKFARVDRASPRRKGSRRKTIFTKEPIEDLTIIETRQIERTKDAPGPSGLIRAYDLTTWALPYRIELRVSETNSARCRQNESSYAETPADSGANSISAQKTERKRQRRIRLRAPQSKFLMRFCPSPDRKINPNAKPPAVLGRLKAVERFRE